MFAEANRRLLECQKLSALFLRAVDRELRGSKILDLA
jgi:hypothetical protein